MTLKSLRQKLIKLRIQFVKVMKYQRVLQHQSFIMRKSGGGVGGVCDVESPFSFILSINFAKNWPYFWKCVHDHEWPRITTRFNIPPAHGFSRFVFVVRGWKRSNIVISGVLLATSTSNWQQHTHPGTGIRENKSWRDTTSHCYKKPLMSFPFYPVFHF